MKINNLKPKEKKRGTAKNVIPSFLLKLYQILDNKEYEKIIYWGETGKYFVVKSLSEFSEKVLPKYFKHNNFASFVRQLNMYDFHKNRNSVNENLFYHKLFMRNQKNLLKLIKRKTNANETIHTNLNHCNCVTDLKSGKRNNVDNSINLIKKVEEISKSYEECEKKIQFLTFKNEEITLQNNSIIQEIYKKNDYSKKLESLLFFIIEMFLPKNTLQSIFNSSDEAKKYQNMIEADQQETAKNIKADSIKIDEPISNTFKNNFSESFFQNIYDKLRESLSNNLNSRVIKTEPNYYPMLSGENTLGLIDNIYKNKEEYKISSNCNPYINNLGYQPNLSLENSNGDDKFNFLKSSTFGQEPNTSNKSFLGRKTAVSSKENSNVSYNNEIFKISKQNIGINNSNFANDEEDLQKYLECNEKNEEASKLSFDTNFLLESDQLFDFNANNGMNNNVNMNHIINHGQDKEYFDTI